VGTDLAGAVTGDTFARGAAQDASTVSDGGQQAFGCNGVTRGTQSTPLSGYAVAQRPYGTQSGPTVAGRCRRLDGPPSPTHGARPLPRPSLLLNGMGWTKGAASGTEARWVPARFANRSTGPPQAFEDARTSVSIRGIFCRSLGGGAVSSRGDSDRRTGHTQLSRTVSTATTGNSRVVVLAAARIRASTSLSARQCPGPLGRRRLERGGPAEAARRSSSAG